MAKIVTLLLPLFAISILTDQNINIPDANFKTSLVDNAEISTDGDFEIYKSEAETYTGPIYVSNKSIADLTGIEYFINIHELDCTKNKISSLNHLDCVRKQFSYNYVIKLQCPTTHYVSCKYIIRSFFSAYIFQLKKRNNNYKLK